jgi:predicted nucleic acid-binding protein
MPQIFVDTSAWYALLDKTDSFHSHAVELFHSLTHPIITTNFIADEIITLVKNRLGHDIAIDIGQKLWNEEVSILIRITSTDEENAWKIFVNYRDKGFSFTDCTSFAIMERLGIKEVLAFDDHFSQYNEFIILRLEK